MDVCQSALKSTGKDFVKVRACPHRLGEKEGGGVGWVGRAVPEQRGNIGDVKQLKGASHKKKAPTFLNAKHHFLLR